MNEEKNAYTQNAQLGSSLALARLEIMCLSIHKMENYLFTFCFARVRVKTDMAAYANVHNARGRVNDRCGWDVERKLCVFG